MRDDRAAFWLIAVAGLILLFALVGVVLDFSEPW
jgi:hypothetical protein